MMSIISPIKNKYLLVTKMVSTWVSIMSVPKMVSLLGLVEN